MRVGYLIPSERRGFFYRWRWLIACAVVTVPALVLAGLGAFGPRVVVYPTTDFAHLPVSTTASSAPAASESCVSIQHIGGSPKLVDKACGSPGSTFRVIGRVGKVSQCVGDADLTYSSSSGAVCLDYDWAADQCLEITKKAVSKVDCSKRDAVRPEMAIIGAVDVTYCREGGIAHSLRHFTVCTLAGDKNCKGRTDGT
jgi:hypothetical protein